MDDDKQGAALAVQEKRIQINAYEQFTPKERALIHRTVAPGTTSEELLMFLSVCAQNNLDPFAREAWCIKMPGRNGAEGKLVMIVGKYGWLKVVNRYSDYRGTVSQVVHANDEFRYTSEPKARVLGDVTVYTHITHDFDVTGERGPLLGAYSEVYREGRPTEFFYAKIDQYQPFSTEKLYDDQTEFDFHGTTVYLSKKDKFSPWLAQTDSMILKCSQTTAWRNAFPLGAVYGEEEMSSAMAPSMQATPVEEEIEYGEDPDLAERMQSVIAAANNAKAGSYPPAKVRLMLTGITDDERYALIAQEIIPFIRNNGGTVPEVGEVVVSDEDVSVEEPEEQPDGPGEHIAPEPRADAAEQDGQEDTLPGV